MKIIDKVIVTNKEWYNYCLLGDWHYGHCDSHNDKINNSINYLAKKNKNEYGVVLAGDLIENILPGSKGLPFELSEPDPNKQIEWASDKISKIKHLVLGSVEGNHELRTRKRTGQYLGKNILDKIYGNETKNYYLGYRGIINLKFKNTKGKLLQNYKIFVTHGSGNASSISGKMSKLHSLRDHAIADIYCQGHIHVRLGFPDYININNIMTKRMFMSCSSYLIDASYAQEFNFKPTDYGINQISLNTRKFDMIGYY